MEFYIFIIALTIFITTLVMTKTLEKYVVSYETDMQSTSGMQMGSSSMQMGSSSMQMGMTQSASDMQMGSSSMQMGMTQSASDTKESFSYDNTAPLFIESKKPEYYIGENRIYNPRPGFS